MNKYRKELKHENHSGESCGSRSVGRNLSAGAKPLKPHTALAALDQRNSGALNPPVDRGQNAPSRPKNLPSQAAKEIKDKAEAPSKEDWEGGASRPTTEPHRAAPRGNQDIWKGKKNTGFESEEAVKAERDL